MAANSKIQWTDHTFNPWIGCTKVHAGCTNCYAEADQANLRKRVVWGPGGTRSRTSDTYWKEPLRWSKAAKWAGHCDRCGNVDDFTNGRDCRCGGQAYERPRVFCASLADIFEDWAGVIVNHKGLIGWRYEPSGRITWRQRYLDPMAHGCRYLTMDDLRADLFRFLFVSAEPLLGPIDMINSPEYQVDWMIFGGESGPSARFCSLDWISAGVHQCQQFGIPPFVKQVGSSAVTDNVNLYDFPRPTFDPDRYGAGTAAGAAVLFRDKKGGDPLEWPESLRVQEFPS